MISRLTASAAVFAFLATTAFGFAAEAQQRPAGKPLTAAASSAPIITLPAVVITGKRATRS